MSWHPDVAHFPAALNARVPHDALRPPPPGDRGDTQALGENARKLLERLNLLAPDPIPDLLLQVPVPFAPDQDAHAAFDELIAHSLATHDAATATFRLRRPTCAEITRERVVETLLWMTAAFAGDPADPQCWPWLTRLVPHAEAIAARADKAGIQEPAGRLVHLVACLLHARSNAPAGITH